MGFLGFGKKEVGGVPVPGEGTLTLPAGKVELRYAEDREGRELRSWGGPGDDLELSVTPSAGGDRLEIRQPRMVQEGADVAIHRKVGTVEIPAAGEYVVTASMTGAGDYAPRIVLRA